MGTSIEEMWEGYLKGNEIDQWPAELFPKLREAFYSGAMSVLVIGVQAQQRLNRAAAEALINKTRDDVEREVLLMANKLKDQSES